MNQPFYWLRYQVLGQCRHAVCRSMHAKTSCRPLPQRTTPPLPHPKKIIPQKKVVQLSCIKNWKKLFLKGRLSCMVWGDLIVKKYCGISNPVGWHYCSARNEPKLLLDIFCFQISKSISIRTPTEENTPPGPVIHIQLKSFQAKKIPS